MHSNNKLPDQRGLKSPPNVKKQGNGLAGSVILSPRDKPSKPENMNLFKSCKLSESNLSAIRERAKEMNVEDSMSSDPNDSTLKPPSFKYEPFSMNSSLADSVLMNNMKASVSSKDSMPSHLANYHHVHNVKAPSFIQDSQLIDRLQDSKNVNELLSSNLNLKGTNKFLKESVVSSTISEN